ncbi:PREDICTED: putative F-box protein At5g62660 [Ipomoea nil]|uniref:putative F-box protein At5g62660 n=1 Tax=Ipomoea nil TaxID=35883 RepID=UPI000900917F|nr:PREDICTED: putative F-box protein At5g62660 [Ipomoea nil]XP_019189308.1 PREDICTED: putative F-box protein At5g62660 [Ipomoea nil]
MRRRRLITTFDDLPEGVLGEIFSRVPVRDLLRAKCVSKFWCDVISSRWFISMQLNKSFSDPTRNYLLLLRNHELPSAVFCTVQSPNILVELDEFKKLGTSCFVVGSINGLVCIACVGLGRWCFLWNPSLRERRCLPKGSILARDRKRVQATLGFGHEPSSDDYKVVRILNFSPQFADSGMPLTRVEVYSFSLDTWKEIEIDFPLTITRRSCDVILNGFIYWLAEKGNVNEKAFVASFDMRREVFQQIVVPDAVIVKSHHYSVMNFRGRLGLLVYGAHFELQKCLQVWMLEDKRSGVGVWTKNLMITMDFQLSYHWGLANGCIVVQNTPNAPFLYDPERKERKIIGVNGMNGVFYYVESLVSIKKRRSRKRAIKMLK